MRITLLLPGFGPLSDSVAQAELAEHCGLDGVWVAEHVGFHDATVTAAACLGRTERLEVGLMGLAPHSRHPAVTAMGLASLSELAPGRVRALLGTGESLLMSRIGVDPARPVSRVRSLICVVRSVQKRETISKNTAIGNLRDFQLHTVASPVSLDVLAIRPRMLALAAELGDGVCLTGGSSRPYLRSAASRVRSLRASHSPSGAPFRITSVVFALIADDWPTHADSLASVFASLSPAVAPIILKGALPDAELARFGSMTSVERLALFTPEVLQQAAILCRPEEVDRAVRDWFDLGLDEICILPMGPDVLRKPALESLGSALSSRRSRAQAITAT